MKRFRKYDEEDEDYEDEEDDIPLHHKKPFGAGLIRKRVEFVKAKDQDEGIGSLAGTNNDGAAVADFYASIVFKGKEPEEKKKETEATHKICDICSEPITTSLTAHLTSMTHQLAIPASRAPSHIDRKRMGYRTLTAQGWDADSPVGLGREGEGIRYPLKVATKEDNLGIGAVLPKEIKKVEKPKPLSAKQLKEQEVKDRKKREKLAQEMFTSSDVDRHLTKGEEWE